MRNHRSSIYALSQAIYLVTFQIQKPFHQLKPEAQTRKEIIDLKLQAAGWNLSDRSQVIEEFSIEVGLPEGVREPRTKYSGFQFSDYVLLGKDGKTLAVVEAKKTSADAAIGREQAKQYCNHIHKKHGGDVPFCFYTNGYDIFFWDLGHYAPRKVFGFPTRDDLERFRYIRKSRQSLADELINTKIVERDYQIHAIRSVNSIEKMEFVEKTFNEIKEFLRRYIDEVQQLENIKARVLLDNDTNFESILVNRNKIATEAQLKISTLNQPGYSPFKSNETQINYSLHYNERSERKAFQVSFDEYRLF